MKKTSKELAELWIKNYDSKNDTFRVKHLEPFLKKLIKSKSFDSIILDIGCGWGLAIKFLRPSHKYIGIDINKNFFPYIKKNYKHKYIKLKEGKLPTKIEIKDNLADLTLCSMVLLDIKNIKPAIKKLFDKTKKGGEICIINLSAQGTKEAIKSFEKNCEKKKNYMKGNYRLPSGIKIKTSIYLHKEEEIESGLKKYGKFKKGHIGKVFVSYIIKKK